MIKNEAVMKSYRIIGYGETANGFFNQPNFASTYLSAMSTYQNLIADPEMDGAVIIEVAHEEWRVIEEFNSSYNISVVYSALGTFRVEKAPSYVFI